MPDLTIESGWMCCSHEQWERQVTGSKGAVYTVRFGQVFGQLCEYDFTCDCPHFRIRHKRCKHIAQARPDWCGWHQQFEAGDVDSDDPKCPKCGGEVVAIRWGA